jgi:hypothetical protein
VVTARSLDVMDEHLILGLASYDVDNETLRIRVSYFLMCIRKTCDILMVLEDCEGLV